MGKTLDALLGRSFKASKFKALVNFAISRLAVLKDQKQARCSLARSDVVQLLQLSEQERALIRVEQVIKEQNMLDVFAMIEGYCILLSERIELTENEKDCPDELKEAISSLVYASSRCGDFPELQQIRSVFASRYGKEFTLRAIELRNSCGVNSKIIQKLSTRQPSLESRIKALKQLANENGISLQLEETLSTAEEGKQDKDQNRIAENQSVGSRANLGDDMKDLPEETNRVESLSHSLNRRKKFKDVADAAQEAYLSAAYATAAAKAAVELSQSTSGGPPDNLNNSKQVSDYRSEEKSRAEASERIFSWEIEDSHLSYHTDHPINNHNITSDEDNKETHQSESIINIKHMDLKSNTSDITSGVLENFEQNLECDESDDEAKSEKINTIDNIEKSEVKGAKHLCYSHNQTVSSFEADSKKDNDEQISTGLSCSQRLNAVKRPYSVRTKR